jgi:hypothetical protein
MEVYGIMPHTFINPKEYLKVAQERGVILFDSVPKSSKAEDLGPTLRHGIEG